MSHWDFGRGAGEHEAAPWAADEGWSTEDGWLEGEGTGAYPISYERPPAEPWPPAPPPAEPEADGEPGDGPEFGRWPADPLAREFPEADLLRDSVRYGGLDEDGRDGPGLRRWLVPAGVTVAAAAVGAAAVLLTSGHPSSGAGAAPMTGGTPSRAATQPAPPTAPAASAPSTAPASASPGPATGAPLTLAQARGVLARYTQANNAANGQRSSGLLSTVETGSSYAIDAGFYAAQRGTGAAPFPAFTPAQATYYIPRAETAGTPRWFAVRVANAFTAKPGQVASTEYLVFTRSSGGRWQNAIEPYVMTGASTPPVALGADGFATAAGRGADATLAAVPGRLPAQTAASLDGGAGGHGAVAIPGHLSDQGDAQRWRSRLPGASVTDVHTAASGMTGREFALRTSNGGALVFYSGAATLTISAPAGATLRLSVPGFLSPARAVTRARIRYLEQFAAYDPPAGTGAPTVIAEFSGITGAS